MYCYHYKNVYVLIFIFILSNLLAESIAVNGVIDFSESDFDNEIFFLDGEWGLVNGEFVDYHKINEFEKDFITIPGKISGHFSCTYFLKVKVSDAMVGKKLYFKNRESNSAIRYYIDDKELFSIGKPGLSAEESIPNLYYKKESFKIQKNSFYIIAHLSNYDFLSGGIFKSPMIGNIESINRKDLVHNIINLFLFGCIAIMLLYHVLIFLLRRKEYSALIFSLFSFVIIIRALMVEKYFQMYYQEYYSFFLKIECITFFLVVPLFIHYIYLLFPRDFYKIINYISYIFFIIISIISLFSSINITSHLVYVAQISTMILIVYVLLGIIKAAYYKRDEIFLFLIGFIILLLVTMNDILFFMRLIHTVQLSQYGMFIFVIFQSLVLSVRFSKAFVENERLNENLELTVEKRSKELSETMDNLKILNKQNLDDLTIAQNIQVRLVPTQFTDYNNLEFSSIYLPMDQLGGDLFDYYIIDEHRIGCMILDVCGHGVPAALITIMAKILFHNGFRETTDTKELIEYVNNQLYDTIKETGDYLTAFLCIIDTDKMQLEYCNAGHNEIYIINDGKIKHILENSAPVVGVLPDLEFPTEVIDLTNDDRLVLYTDGVVEAMDINRNLYGIDRFKQQMNSCYKLSGSEFILNLISDIMHFKGHSDASDDIAIIAIDVKNIYI